MAWDCIVHLGLDRECGSKQGGMGRGGERREGEGREQRSLFTDRIGRVLHPRVDSIALQSNCCSAVILFLGTALTISGLESEPIG